ncbi:MAG: glycosyltransferase family 4 protein [Anaerolineae bacterium]|nr:glycosyltransferase family 4 protein [Anaerolineae bacterium]
MRIGFITGEYPPMQGGVGAFTQEMARAIKALGHEVRVLTSVGAADGRYDDGIPVDAIVDKWRWGALRAAQGWARGHRLDVVNVQYQTAAYNMSPYIHLLPRRLRRVAAVFTTFHDLREPYLFPKAGSLRTYAVLMLARDAAGAIVTNREDEEILEVDPNINLRRIAIGSNITASARPPDYSRAGRRAKIGAGERDLVVGYFGFLNKSKGAHVLVGAAAKARDAGVPVRLLMIGGRVGSSDATNTEYGATVDRLIDVLDLNDRVFWTGFVGDEEVSAYFDACDLCALPYRDGVSFRRGTFMAAIAHGCAVITTRPFVELPELAHRENVYLVERRDPDALAQGIIDLADQPALREKLGRGARRLSELFTWDKLAAQTVAFFEETAGR